MKTILNILVLATGAAAAITLATPIVLFLTLTIIGIPIALVLMATPTLFLASLLTKLFYAPFSRFKAAGFIAPVLAIGVLCAIPLKINATLERQATSFVADDHDNLKRPFSSKVIAIRRVQQGSSEEPCDGFCKRALLNGLVDRVLIQTIDTKRPNIGKATSYRLERRTACPAIELQQGNDITIDSESHNFGQKTVDDILRLRIANGDCLIGQTAPLSDADTIFTVRKVHQGKNEYSAGLDWNADTISADRITVEQKDGDQYRETYRWTRVVVYKLRPIFAPTIVSGYGFQNHPGLWRDWAFKNIPGRYYEGPDWSQFVTKTLGMDLALRRDGLASQIRDKLIEIFDRPGPVTPSDQQIINGFFDGFLQARSLEQADYPLVLRAIEDRRVAIPQSAGAAVRLAKDAEASYAEKIADAVFGQLREIDATHPGQPEAIAEIVMALPASAISRHRDDLEWLAHQDKLRVKVYPALTRLSVFGADAAPTLLFLIDDAERTGNRRENDWQHPYLQGLIGLCGLGPDASAMIQPLFDRIDAGKIALWGSYRRLTIATLAAMGSTAEDIWRHTQADKDPNNTLQRTVRTVAETARRRECTY